MTRVASRIEKAIRVMAVAVRIPTPCTRASDRAHAGDLEKILAMADAIEAMERQKDVTT